MALRVIGAGLPRTGTNSQRVAFEHLLGGKGYHMSIIPGHPFDLGAAWDLALADGSPDWDQVFEGYTVAVDWPASMFWREISEVYPDALILLSVRDSAKTWWESCNATFLPHARMALAPDWDTGRGLTNLLERFTGTKNWDDPEVLMAAYERYNEQVRQTAPRERFLEWRASEGWEPICAALGLPVPAMPFPFTNQRDLWGK